MGPRKSSTSAGAGRSSPIRVPGGTAASRPAVTVRESPDGRVATACPASWKPPRHRAGDGRRRVEFNPDPAGAGRSPHRRRELHAGQARGGRRSRRRRSSEAGAHGAATAARRSLGTLALFAYMAPFSFAYLRIGAALGALVLFGTVQITMIALMIGAGIAWGCYSLLGRTAVTARCQRPQLAWSVQLALCLSAVTSRDASASERGVVLAVRRAP